MQTVVTGGAGFIGSHLAEALLEEGAAVTVLDNLSTGNRDWVPDNATFIEADIRDRDALLDAFKDCDQVYHLAAHTDVRAGATNHDLDFEQNVVGTKHVLEAVRQQEVPELVFPSSSTVYGEADAHPIPEDYSPLQPISHYGASKLACESLLSAYAHLFDIDVTVLRLANIVGQRAGKGVIHDFQEKLRKTPNELEVLGNGKQQKSYLHIDDCVSAFQHLPQQVDGHQTYNIGAADAITVTEIAEIVIDTMDLNAAITYTGGERGWSGDVPAFLLDIARAQNQGWTPTRSSADAVREAVTT